MARAPTPRLPVTPGNSGLGRHQREGKRAIVAEGDVRVPAGWYPDPLGLPQLRWWDNHAWTEYTSDARQPMVAQDTVTQQAKLTYADDDAEDEGLTRRERRERERDVEVDTDTDSDGIAASTAEAKPTAEALLALEAPVREEMVEEELSPAAKFAEFVPSNAPTTPAFNLDSRFDDLLGESVASKSSFAHVSESTTTFLPDFGESFTPTSDAQSTAEATGAAVAADAARAGTNTMSVWLIATAPLFTLLVGMFFLLGGFREDALPIAYFLIWVFPFLATIGLAILDRRQLRDRGIQRPATWMWSLLTTPVYLVARFLRTVRQTGRGIGPLVGWVLLSALSLATPLAVPGMIIVLQPSSFSQQVETSVEQDAAALGESIEVFCPKQPPTIVGDDFTCIAKQADEANPISWGITVSLQRSNGWIDWQVDDWGVFQVDTAENAPATTDGN